MNFLVIEKRKNKRVRVAKFSSIEEAIAESARLNVYGDFTYYVQSEEEFYEVKVGSDRQKGFGKF